MPRVLSYRGRVRVEFQTLGVGYLARRMLRRAALGVPRPARGELAGMRLTLAARGYHRGDYEPALARTLKRLTEPGFVCADVGAHFGYMSLLLARLTNPGGRVVAFEASPRNVSVIERHIRLNGLGGTISVVPMAVADGLYTSLELFARTGASSEWTLSHQFARRDKRGRRDVAAVRVPATSLDAQFPDDHLDLVKIDVEGAEGLVIAGMRRLLARARPIVVLEFHRPMGWEAVRQLEDAGYRLETLEGVPLPLFETPSEVPYQFVATPRAKSNSATSAEQAPS
jgi:FkbM family methyltransferase